MATLTRRQVLAMLGAAGGLLGLGYAVRGVVGTAVSDAAPARADGSGMPMSAPGMMNMQEYMVMFSRHRELRRHVEEIPGGVRTTTESDSPDLVAELQEHVAKMYANLNQGAEVSCMSSTLPTMFRRAVDYQRQITYIPTGVVTVETSADPHLTQVIREHAAEVTGFVNEGMPAMMGPMMGGGMMGPGGMGPHHR